MSNYTGPILDVIFQGVKKGDRFGFTFFTHADDAAEVKRITARFAEDGYKPDKYTKGFMVNGSRVDEGERDWRPTRLPPAFGIH